MTEIQRLMREANQMIVGERLYYAVYKRGFKLLESYATQSPSLKQAITEAHLLDEHPTTLYLVPADLIKEAEEDMLD